MKKPESDKCNSTLSIRIPARDLSAIKKAAKTRRWPIAMLVREACAQFIGATK